MSPSPTKTGIIDEADETTSPVLKTGQSNPSNNSKTVATSPTTVAKEISPVVVRNSRSPNVPMSRKDLGNLENLNMNEILPTLNACVVHEIYGDR